MTKLTAGTLSVFLGLVALDANAAVTSKRYVDDAIKAASNELSTTINNLTADGGDIATKIADAVSAEETRATAAEDAINATIGKTEELTTTDKESIVGAINSLQAKTTELATGTGLTLGEDSVTADNIEDGAITAGKIENGAVSSEKIEDGAITAGKIENGAVSSEKLEDGAVTADKIENGAVTSEKLADVEGLTAGTATKVTVNAKGQITKAEQAALSDITNVPTQCTTADAECVLKYSAADGFKWEDIAETYTASVGGDTGE